MNGMQAQRKEGLTKISLPVTPDNPSVSSQNPENPTWYCFHSCFTDEERQHREVNCQHEDTQLNCGLLISKSWFIIPAPQALCSRFIYVDLS